MQKINSAAMLRDAIVQLEARQAEEEIILKEQFRLAYDNMKPLNFIKNIFKEAAASVELKENVINTSVGLAAGYVSKKLFEGVSNNPLKRLLGSALMFGITNIVTKNPEGIKTLGKKFLKIIKSRQENRVNGNGISDDKATHF